MLSKVVIIFLLLMVAVAMIGKALTGGARKLGKPPVCPRCGRYLTGRETCDCARKG